MPKKDDELIFDTPSLKPDRDALIDRQFTHNASTGPETSPAGVGLFVRLVCLILSLAVLGLVWFSLQQNDSINGYKSQLNNLEMRLFELEKVSNKTSETHNITSSETAEQLKTLDSEIRKLWDNVWAKSKKRFKTLETTQTSAVKELQALSKQNEQLEQQAVKLKNNLDKHTALLSESADQISALQNTQQALQTLSKKLAKQQDELQALRSLASQQAEINKRLDAIDAFRRQVNAQLEQLRQEHGL